MSSICGILLEKLSEDKHWEYNYRNTNPHVKSLINFILSAPLNERVTIRNSRVNFLLNILKRKKQENPIYLFLGMLYNLLQIHCNTKKRGNQVVLKKIKVISREILINKKILLFRK